MYPGSGSDSEGKFDNDFPLLLPFNTDLLSRNRSINCVKDLATFCDNIRKWGTLAMRMSPPSMKQNGWLSMMDLRKTRVDK